MIVTHPLPRQRCSAWFVLMVLAAGCGREASKPAAAVAPPVVRAVQQRPHVPDEWWLPGCGNVQPLQVGHDVTSPVLVHRVEPKMPETLHHRGRVGIIIMEAVINDAGVVCAARVVKTFEGQFGAELAASALEAVKQWKFRPAKLNGTPRACVYSVSVRLHPR